MGQLGLRSAFAKSYTAKGKQSILSCDGAPARTTKRLRVPARMTLPGLPPYAPKLNPAKNLWPTGEGGRGE